MTEFARSMSDIVSLIHPTLKSFGFRKRRHTFNRAAEKGLIHVVNFQMGQYEFDVDEIPGLRPKVYGLFTVNLGVYLEECHRAYFSDRPAPSFPHEYECEIRWRLGDLIPSPNEAWWPLSLPEPEVASSMSELLARYGIQQMDALATRSDVLAYLLDPADRIGRNQRARLSAAVILYRLGRVAEAESVIGDYYEDAVAAFPQHVTFVREVAERLSLTIGPKV